MTPNTPTLSTPATPGSTSAQRGVAFPEATPRPPRLLWHCAGDVLFQGRPIHMVTARHLSFALRREACDEVSDTLWAIYHQAREAIAEALAWRGVSTINSNERRVI